MLEPEKMLEGIFCELPLTTRATPTPQRQHINAHTHVSSHDWSPWLSRLVEGKTGAR
jgi:hypothetical protein